MTDVVLLVVVVVAKNNTVGTAAAQASEPESLFARHASAVYIVVNYHICWY